MQRFSDYPLDLFIERKELINVQALATEGKKKLLITDADAVLFRHGESELTLSTELLLMEWSNHLQVAIGSNNPEPRDELGRGGRGYHRLSNVWEVLRGDGKPNPDFILNICNEYAISPEETVVIDDCLLRGGLAAIGAGALSITLDRQGNDPIYDWLLYLRYRESLLCRDHGILRHDGKTIDAGHFLLPPQFRLECALSTPRGSGACLLTSGNFPYAYLLGEKRVEIEGVLSKSLDIITKYY